MLYLRDNNPSFESKFETRIGFKIRKLDYIKKILSY